MAHDHFIRIEPLAGPFDYSFYSDDYLNNNVYMLQHGMSSILSVVTEPFEWFMWFNGSRGYEPSEPLVLFDACSDNSNHEKDCGEVCNEPETLFGSWRMLWQCLLLASLSFANSSILGVDEGPKKLVAETLQRFNLSNSTQGPAILNMALSCATASCNDTSMGSCQLREPLDIDVNVYGGFEIFARYASWSYDLCTNLQIETNPDIFGAGVAISYTIQLVIALFAWLAIRVIGLKTTINSFASPFGFLRKKQGSFTDRHPFISSILTRMEQTNLAHATKTFASEFQEAQSFFVIAVQIALLYAKPLPADANGSNNWQSLVLDRQTGETLGLQAALLLTLVQISLNQAQLASYYSFLLFFIAEALVGVAWRTATKPNLDQVYEIFKGQHEIPECGGNPSLRTFCFSTSYATNGWGIRFLGRTVFGSTSAVIILLLQKLWDDFIKVVWLKKVEMGVSTRCQIILSRTRFVIAKVTTFSLFGCEVLLIAFLSLSLFDDINLGIRSNLTDATRSKWNVGQVIAVLVWAPVISRYLYLITVGIEKGFKVRLSRSFAVVKVD